MKKAFLLLITTASFSCIKAQIKEGTIVYERKINQHRAISDEQMKAMLPEFRTSRHQLIFSDSVSLFKLLPEDEAPDPFASSGGPRIIMRMSGSDGGDLYKNFKVAQSVSSQELGGKTYLITDSIKQQPWKIGTETKQILGYTCIKAIRKMTVQTGGVRRMSFSSGGGAPQVDTTAAQAKPREIEIVAWYAENLVSPAGPDSYGLLPGVILELNMDNGATVYTATEVKKTADSKDLKEPKKGKAITSAEFNKLRLEMISNQLPAGGGSFRIGG